MPGDEPGRPVSQDEDVRSTLWGFRLDILRPSGRHFATVTSATQAEKRRAPSACRAEWLSAVGCGSGASRCQNAETAGFEEKPHSLTARINVVCQFPERP